MDKREAFVLQLTGERERESYPTHNTYPTGVWDNPALVPSFHIHSTKSRNKLLYKH
jgi:hypothetical protein